MLVTELITSELSTNAAESQSARPLISPAPQVIAGPGNLLGEPPDGAVVATRAAHSSRGRLCYLPGR